MSIVCGTDFSEHSSNAVAAAARLAARMNMPLHLVHAVDVGAAELAADADRDRLSRVGARLLVEKERLAAAGADVRVHARQGAPDDVLLEVASHEQAKLIVVAALGQRAAGKWQLGSHSDRLAQLSSVPVLVVRVAQPFEDWVANRRPLRVMLGVDFSQSAVHAMRWASSLGTFGPCDVTAVHVYWPPDQFTRLGLSGVRDYMGPHPEVVQTLQGQLAERLAEVFGSRPVRLLIKPNIGRVADRIARLASDEQADLLVVGSHRRDPLERVMAGSVSNGVLHCAQLSVACVPAPSLPVVSRPGRIASVLVATDFSETGNAAVALAYSLVARGGRVHLAHVVPERAHRAIDERDIFVSDEAVARSEPHAAARLRLDELILPGYAGHVASQVHVLESGSPAEAIAQAAERLDADLVCLGTHGRSGVAKVLVGSVAQAVLQHTQRPVLFARAPKA